MSILYEVKGESESRIKKYARWCDRFGPFETSDGQRGVGPFTMVRCTSNETPYTVNLRCLHATRKKAYGHLPQKCNVFAVLKTDGTLIRRRYVHNHMPMECLPEARFECDAVRIFQPMPSLYDVLSLLSTDGRGRKRKRTTFEAVPGEVYEISSSSNDLAGDDAEQNGLTGDHQKCLFQGRQVSPKFTCEEAETKQDVNVIISISDSNETTSIWQKDQTILLEEEDDQVEREVEKLHEEQPGPHDDIAQSSIPECSEGNTLRCRCPFEGCGLILPSPRLVAAHLCKTHLSCFPPKHQPLVKLGVSDS